MKQTSIAIIIKNEKVLLEKRKDTEDNYAGLYALPGGHMKEQETPEQALVREIKEELNIEITKYKKLLPVPDIDPTSGKEYIHHTFLIQEWKGEIKETKEQEKLVWANLNEIHILPNISKPTMKALRQL